MHVAQVVVFDALGPGVAEGGVGREHGVHEAQQALAGSAMHHPKLHCAFERLRLDDGALRADEVGQLVDRLAKLPTVKKQELEQGGQSQRWVWLL